MSGINQNIPPVSGLAVGSTVITGGVDGRVLYQNAGVIGQSNGLVYNSAGNGSLTILGLQLIGGGATNLPILNLQQNLWLYNDSAVLFRLSESSVNNTFSFETVKLSGSHTWNLKTGGNGSGANTESTFMSISGDNFGNGQIYIAKPFVNIGYGITGGGGARLDIKAADSSANSIFRIRNSGNDTDIIKVSGNYKIHGFFTEFGQFCDGAEPRLMQQGQLSWFEVKSTRYNNASENLKSATTIGKIAFSGDTAQNKLNFVNSSSYWGLGGVYSGGFHWYKSGTSGDPYVNGITASCLDANKQMSLTPDNALLLYNTAGINYLNNENSFQLYAAEISAGNSIPNFRTGLGHIIKLFRQDLPAVPDNAQIATLLSNLGLANLT